MRSARIDRILALIDDVLDDEPQPVPVAVARRGDGRQVVVPFRPRDARPATRPAA